MRQGNWQVWGERFSRAGAIFLFGGNPKQAHSILPTKVGGEERHARGFFQPLVLIKQVELLGRAISDLAQSLPKPVIEEVDYVIGPAAGGLILADLLALNITEQRGRPCLAIQARDQTETGFCLDPQPEPERRALICDDFCHTGRTVTRLAEQMREKGVVVLPHMLQLVNQSRKKELDGMRIWSLLDWSTNSFSKDDCPLCNQQSPAVDPDDPKNWESLKDR